ncbi:MAG TPA: hypothetical protein DCL21_06455 [Alphaproteobacteria bacterium]|nr:hypothetical protein [Alphaproteobacteria bacterium]
MSNLFFVIIFVFISFKTYSSCENDIDSSTVNQTGNQQLVDSKTENDGFWYFGHSFYCDSLEDPKQWVFKKWSTPSAKMEIMIVKLKKLCRQNEHEVAYYQADEHYYRPMVESLLKSNLATFDSLNIFRCL